MKRRFLLVPFIHRPREENQLLREQLREEGPGILAWFIAGAKEWYANGLGSAESIRDATGEYFDSQDTISQWLADRMEVQAGNRNFFEKSTALLESFNSYAKSKDRDKLTSHSFGSEMKARGFKKNDRTFPDGKKTAAFEGLRFNSVAEDLH